MADFIKGTCYTNLDDYNRVEWPDAFARVPIIGERVEGRCGDMRPTLRVVGITHRMVKTSDGARGPVWQPAISVELHR
jgi:hypothetical protein